MQKRKSEYRRGLWIPGMVGLLGALIVVAIWSLLVADRRARLLERTEDIALQTAAVLEMRLELQVESLRGRGDLWRDFGMRPLPEWRARVNEWIDRVPGLASVAWVDVDEPRHRVAAGKTHSADEIEVDTNEARRHHDTPYLAGPERDATGAIIYRVLLPVRSPEEHAGVLVARFYVEPFLQVALSALAPGYALSISWGEETIFSRGAPSTDPWQQWWRIEADVPLPLGGKWSVVFRPTRELAAARLTPVPHYLLATGMVLALILAATVHQLRIIARQSRFLAASNRALEQRGRELETKVAERTEALRETVAELEAFNYSVSHDLRSPLGAILNFTSILEEDYSDQPLNAEGIAVLARIRRSATRATVLLEDFLRLSRAGRSALTLEPLDMTALARETFANDRAAERGGDVEFIVDPLPEVVGDRTLLTEVFSNFFSNALKYSRGRPRRRIVVSGRVENGTSVYEIADNGHGFDMRFADKLFGLFERLHPPQDIEGTGVGLAIVARIVKRHGGRVWGEGRPGEGARFFFAIPRRRAS